MSEYKICEVCGQEKHISDFSKSYKGRCKKCVAAQTKEKRKQPLRDIDKKRKARKMNIKQKIKDLQCKCFGHKPIVEVYAMRVHGKQHKKFHVVRETTCMRCGETIKFEMTDLKSRAELLQEGWFIEIK